MSDHSRIPLPTLTLRRQLLFALFGIAVLLAGPALFSDFIRRGRPNCGRLDRQKLEYLFGPQAGETGSAALIPLSAPPLAGVLAIGSRDPDRFHEGKSVDFLQRLAEVVSVTLQSAAGPGV